MPTIGDGITDAAAGSNRCVRFLGSGQPVETTWSKLTARAERRAGGLHREGVRPGDRIAVYLETSSDLVEVLFALWLMGATPVVLPLPLRGAPARHRDDIRSRLAGSGAGRVVVGPAWADHGLADDGLEARGHPQTLDVASLSGPPWCGEAVDQDATAVLQFTSGSTGQPKAVLLSHAAVMANIDAIHEAIALDAELDTVFSWLPLYHDMGLVGTFLSGALMGLTAAYAPTSRFALQPGLWMRACSELGATILAAPDYAYALATRVLRRNLALDLSAIRVAMCGGERVRASTLAALREAGAAYGWREETLTPCYGLAEATLAVTMSDHAERYRVHQLDPDTPGDLAGSGRAVVGVGRAIRGCRVRIVGDPAVDPTGALGEIHVTSPALMTGYEVDGRLDTTPIATGWLATGDLGYLVGEELFVCGRRTESLIVNGTNISPVDLEEIAYAAGGLRQGSAAAFATDGADGREMVTLVVEPSSARHATRDHGAVIGRAIADQLGFRPRRVVFVRPGAVPRTTSGKVRRLRARDLYIAGDLEVVAEHIV